MMTNAAHVGGIEFLALASPGRLALGKCRVAAALCINWRLAVEGRAHPAGEVVVGFGSEPEVEAAMARARTEASSQGGLYAVEYSPKRDEVRVEALIEVAARGRVEFSAGAASPEGWFVVHLGSRIECQHEATRLRRVRAGHRAYERRGA